MPKANYAYALKNLIAILLLVVLQVIGGVCLSRGMKQVGAVNTLNLPALLTVGERMIANPWFMAGLLLLIAFFLVYLATLSRLELTYVLPMLASSYVLTAVLAWLVLGETVSPQRWVGTLAISLGVLLVGLSEKNKLAKSTARQRIEE